MKRSELPAATLLILVTMLLATHSHSTAAEKSHVCSSRVVPSLGIQFSSYAGKLKQQRIVVASPPNRFERVKEQDEFANSIVRYLGGVRGKSVHRAPQVLCAHRSPFASGRFDEHFLVECSKSFAADSVLFCDVRQMSGFAPMRLQINLLLVDCRESVTIAFASFTVDMQDALIARWYDRVAVDRSPQVKKDSLHRNSPRQFIDSVAKLAAQELLSGLQ